MVRMDALEVDFILFYTYVCSSLATVPAYTVRTYVQYIIGHLGCIYSKYVFYTLLVENVSVYSFPQMTPHTRCALSNQSTE